MLGQASQFCVCVCQACPLHASVTFFMCHVFENLLNPACRNACNMGEPATLTHHGSDEVMDMQQSIHSIRPKPLLTSCIGTVITEDEL